MSNSGNVTERELLPCPFCGGEGNHHSARLEQCVEKLWTWVSCTNCRSATAKSIQSDEQAIDAWNTRANERLQGENVSERDKLFDGKTYQASDDYIKGWEDSRAFSSKNKAAIALIDEWLNDKSGYDEIVGPKIKAALAKEDNGWISVDKRLPELKENTSYSETVLALSYRLGVSFIQSAWWEKDINSIIWFSDVNDMIINNVTHWMPMMELPE